MPISEAAEFFEPISAIHRYMATLVDVGLGYVRLGQSATTLSGGEAQRVKLATELQRRSNGRTVYVLDEPTTGLHFEGRPEAAARAAESGRQGQHGDHDRAQPRRHQVPPTGSSTWGLRAVPAVGTVLATGTPEHVATSPESNTGVFLREIFDAQDARVGKEQGGRRAAGHAEAAARRSRADAGATKQKAGAR